MKLIIEFSHNDKITTHELSLQVRTTVGRSSKNVIQIHDEKISSVHCQFILTKNGLEIRDLSSKNGIYLNGIRIESSEIFIGDEIRLGQTNCKINESLSDPDAIDLLTFPGRTKDRIAFELRADFTGARTQNQMNFKNNQLPNSILPPLSLAKEIAIRKKAKSPIKVSKASIHENNKGLSFVAKSVDYLCLFMSLLLPFYMTSSISAQLSYKQLVVTTIVIELLSIGNFYLYNFKKRKFTIGEEVAGIRKKYEGQ
jgi:predicted component of type VI protein secretion system